MDNGQTLTKNFRSNMENTQSYQSFLKSPHFAFKHSTYFQAYDDILSQYRGKEITFVEIGILGGGSLFMWRDFFGPQARIIGVDLNPSAKKWESEGFEVFIGSQSSPDFWRSFVEKVGPIDVVLDDGGHTYEQQIITVEELLGSIKDGGKLIIEDTHTSYMSGFGPKKYSFIEYTKMLIDAVNQRFGAFGGKASEKRIWSIAIYESIVSFSVNKRASTLVSNPVWGSGSNDGAIDYRFGEPKTWSSRFEKWKNKYALNLFFNCRKYFK
jgi:hypothetical protein